MKMVNRWSYSRFATADGCLKFYASQYEVPPEERLPTLYSHLRETGKGVHRCREIYVQHLIDSNLEQDLEIVSMIVEEYFSTDPEVTTTECYNDVLAVFKAFAQRYRHNPETYFGGELMTDRALPETDIIVAGYPDHIEKMTDDEGPIVVAEDMKAGYSASVTPENKLQGEIEAWKLAEWFPGNRVGWRVSWPRAGAESTIAEFRPNFAPVLESRLRAIIARVNSARENQNFPAQPGAACSYCPLAIDCRERIVAAEAEILATDPESAQKALGDLILTSAAYSQRREQVKAWVDDHGPISVNDLEAGYVKKLGGDQIGDIGIMLLALGLAKLIGEGVFQNEDDPAIKSPESQRLISAAGAEIAIRENLIVINGNKTKLKGVKADPRLRGLWVPSDPKTQFDLYRVERSA